MKRITSPFQSRHYGNHTFKDDPLIIFFANIREEKVTTYETASS
jgi:hypothetical protein